MRTGVSGSSPPSAWTSASPSPRPPSTPTRLIWQLQLCRLGRIWSGPRRLLYVAWKVVNLPFDVIAGGMGVVLGTLRHGARAFNGALAFLGFSPGQHKLYSDAVGTRATHLSHDILLEIACRLGPPRRNVQAMRSTCPAWRAGVPNTNGPLLIMSRLDDEVVRFGI